MFHQRQALHLPRRLAVIGLWLALPVILWVATQPITLAAPFEGIDKVEHALTFLVLAWLAAAAHPRLPELGRFIVLFCYGGLIEVAQSTIPYRDASFADMLANGSGLFVYFLIKSRAGIAQKTTKT